MRISWMMILTLLMFCSTSGRAMADTHSSHIKPEQLENLSHHPVWQKLIHHDEHGEGEILDHDFYLSPSGKQSAKAELRATIDAYYQPWPEKSDSHPRCRFPARYLWLSKQIDLPGYTIRDSHCGAIEKWALFQQLQSVSYMLVSGYLGNPGSTFGHSLLKFNTSGNRTLGLFDLSASYGALIPDNEPTLRYVFKGLFGGYKGGFSDKYYYMQDLVYSHTEFRDVWEYELNLTEYQRTLLVLHIWEIVGRKFDYLFLTENCGYRLSELMEMVTGESFLENTDVWYIPVETFHRLNSVDQKWRGEGKEGLIKSVRFIPSAQRKLNHQASLLHRDERAAVETIIQQGSSSIETAISSFSKAQQIRILEAGLAYSSYRITSEQPEPSRSSKELKTKLLISRLGLPASDNPLPDLPHLASPADGNRPMLIAVGGGYESHQQGYVKVRIAPFSQETSGNNTLQGDEIALLDGSFGFGGKQHKAFVEKLDFIRIRKLKDNILDDNHDSPWSWQMQAGILMSEKNNQPRYDGQFRFGVGRTWRINQQLALYAMSDGAGHALFPHFRLRPHAGLVAEFGQLKGWLYGGIENRNYKGKADAIYGAQLQYALADQLSLFAELAVNRSTKASAELRWHW